MSLRARMSRVEQTLNERKKSATADDSARLLAQLDDLSDEELEKLEAIHLRSMEVAGCSPMIPEECGLDLQAFIAFVEADAETYFAAVAEFAAGTPR